MMFEKRLLLTSGVACLLCGLLGSAVAQGIYTCVDDKGRRLNSDRPIAECMDRPQRELSPSGTVRRILTPPPPPKSREQMVAEEKAESEARIRRAEETRRDRELTKRYPDRASYDKARAASLAQVSDVIKTATERTQELTDQRKEMGTELDFYKNSPGRVPPAIKRRVDETDAGIAEQKRLIADKEAEKTRLTERFDAEFVRLQPKWAAAGASAASAAASSAPKP
jgi:hypothetical protein